MPGKNKRKKEAKRKKRLQQRKATAPAQRKERCYKWSADGTKLYELHPLSGRVIRLVPPEQYKAVGVAPPKVTVALPKAEEPRAMVEGALAALQGK